MRVIRRNKKTSNKALKIVIIILILFAVSVIASLIWQGIQYPNNSILGRFFVGYVSENSAPSENTSNTSSLSSRNTTSSQTSSSSSSQSTSSSSQQEEGTAFREPFANDVPLSAKVSNIYFEDAIFFGDSISTGIPLYNVAGNPDTVAFTGLNPISAKNEAVIVTDEGNKTILEAAQKYGEKNKVYIMLGSNCLDMQADEFINSYSLFVDAAQLQYPDAYIYIQSILPVTRTASEEYPSAHNEVIEQFNAALAKMCLEKKIYFVDIAYALMDDEGFLPTDASPLDGMHLTPEYYEKWFDYLKTHTVQEK